MFKGNTLSLCRRLYHNNPSSRSRAPVVKVANKRISDTIRRRRDAESEPRLRDSDISRRFEPFPFAITEENKVEVLNNVISPLISTPYEEQLASKQTYCKNSLRHIAQQLYSSGTPIRLDVSRMPCNINPIVGTPQLYKYRNSDDFSIWRGLDGVTNTVGYMAFPIAKHGDTVCIEPTGCKTMKDETIKLAEILQEFIRKQAKLSVSYTLGTDGGWRRFMIRSNLLGDQMLVGFVNPRTLRCQDLMDETENFKNFVLQRSQEAGLPLKSIYFQPCPHNNCPPSVVPYQLLYGEKTITETINGFKFIISPETFIHHNTKGSEVLYETVEKVLDECFSYNKSTDKKPLVINSNCGAGVLAIHLAEVASKVIGVHNSAQAIDDAIANAKSNGIDNTEFIYSHFEIVLERLLEKYSHLRQDTLVICNAPKVGLHENIICSLRQCGNVRKVLYITSKIGGNGAIDDLVKFCIKSNGKGPPPFALISATPVDVYPHIEACETIVALERLPE